MFYFKILNEINKLNKTAMKKLFLILYNQINLSYFDTNISSNFLYVHYNWKIKFNNDFLNLNIKSKILDYAFWYNFIQELKSKWFNSDFLVSNNFYDAILNYCKDNWFDTIYLVKPSENYVYNNFLDISKKLISNNINIVFLEDNISFFISHEEFLSQYKKPPVMEVFYRYIRKKLNILMDWNNPIWWKWNYDKENRWFDKNHKTISSMIFEETDWLKKAKEFYKNDEYLNYPTNREQSIRLLNHFIINNLDNFWRLEDAMYQNDDYVYHSNLSTAINYWLLSAKEVVEIVSKQDTSINNKEWFIRQILGWREYMYHFFQFYKEYIYKNNYLNHNNKLPDYFWWENINSCKMNCLKTSISRVINNSYWHHIERLMIIWNFCLLTNINPLEVNKWFFEKYTDAFEWVVTPNVMWMSQFSDWWKLATKPYISSWNYINKMSDFCKSCEYNVKTKYEKDSCPFNYLYWHFVNKNKDIFKNTRQPFVVKNLEKIDIEIIKNLQSEFMKK